MHILFVVLGFCYSVGQALIIREFLAVFYGNEIIIGLVFGAWFFWISIGSLISARFSDRTKRRQDLFVLLQLIFPLLLLCQIIGIRIVRLLLNVPSAELFSLSLSMFAVFIISMPCSMVIGMLFPLGCRIAGDANGTGGPFSINKIYIVETLGSVAGGLVFSLVCAGIMSHPAVLMVLTCFLMTGVLWFVNGIYAQGENRQYVKIYNAIAVGLGLIALFCVAITPLRKNIERYFNYVRWNSIFPDITYVESRNSRYQHLSIGKRGNQFSILGNSKFISSFPETHEHVKFSAVLFAQNPSAENILVIGGGADGLLREILNYPVKHIDYVELDRQFLRMIKKYLSVEDRKVLNDSRITVHTVDARYFVQSLKDNTAYDLITVQLPDPSSAYLNRYYTIEFFQQIKDHLSFRGVFVTGGLASENYFNIETANYTGSIYKTLKAVFPHIAVAPGERILFFAGLSPGVVASDYQVLAKRYKKIPVKHKRFPPESFRTVFQPERIGFVSAELEKSQTDINTDTKPITYYFNMLLWAHFSGSEWIRVLEIIRTGGMWVFLLPFIIFIGVRFLYAGRFHNPGSEARCNAFVSIFSMGFAAMALQVVLIFMYQSLFGYVYERIGIINALFMLGLTGGAFMAHGLIPRIKQRELPAAVILCVMGALVFLIPLCVNLRIHEVVFYVFFIISGLLTGSIFPFGTRLYYAGSSRVGETAGILDSADHLGAMAGALAGGALMVPLIGIQRTCWVLGGIVFLSSILLFQSYCNKNKASYAVAYRSFPYGKTSWIMLCMVLSIYAVTAVIRSKEQKSDLYFEDHVLSHISGSARFEYREDPFPHYVGFTVSDEIDSITLSTRGLAGDIRGYGGPVNLLLSVSSAGKIRGIFLFESQETPAYISGIGTWLKKFKGFDTRARYPITYADIDALTGATVTSDAVMKIVNTAVQRIDREILKYSAKKKDYAVSLQKKNLFFDYRILIVIILFVMSIWAYLRRGKILRLTMLILNLAFFGIAANMLFTFINIGTMSIGKLPGIENIVWIVFAVLVFFVSLLFGQVFCGYICPFGVLQELCSMIGLARAPHAGLEKKARYLKYIILAGAISMFWISGSIAWISFNPMNYIFGNKFTGLIIVFTVLILICSVFFVRFWCRYFCPAGAFLSFFNKIELLRFLAPKKNYSKCDLGIRDQQDIDCIKCNRCRF